MLSNAILLIRLVSSEIVVNYCRSYANNIITFIVDPFKIATTATLNALNDVPSTIRMRARPFIGRRA